MSGVHTCSLMSCNGKQYIPYIIVQVFLPVCTVQKQNLELKQLRRQLDDDIIKLRAGVKLDLNLEKSRALEAVSKKLSFSLQKSAVV